MQTAWLDEQNIIRVDFAETDDKPINEPIIKDNKNHFQVDSIHWDNKTATIKLVEFLPMDNSLYIEWNDVEIPIYPRDIVRSPIFDQMYDASKELLGANYSPDQTTFSVWSPIASNMVLVLVDETYQMSRNSNGVWSKTIDQDCHLMSYYFKITVHGKEEKVNDPYAKSMTANSQEAVVIDVRQFDPDDFRKVPSPDIRKEETIIYELHIRDATVAKSSGVKHRGKFLGLTERETTNPENYSTGLSYIRELGCTHVQLLPVQDFARVNELKPDKTYNWGYDPLYYFVPEGSFSTDPKDPKVRIKELKQMIQAFHEENLSVILDVVFNHVFEHETSAFEKLVPGYYFRYTKDGQVSNATGTGNDLATERKMVRKFILDCVDYLLTEYRIDGFRFDLMGIIDVETMRMIRNRCEQEDRSILLLGEGWEMDTPLSSTQKSTISQSDQLCEISFFNDRFRDIMKGNIGDPTDKGFTNGNGHYIERLPQLVSGSSQSRYGDAIFSDPLQSVNYVECHDNHTLWDRLQLSNPNATAETQKRMHQLATGITILSQGIPFIHAGQEFYRTKQGDDNSYIAGDSINQLDWYRREKEDHYVQWVRNLIQLRKNYRLLRLGDTEEIKHRLHTIFAPDPVFGYLLAGAREDLAIFINPANYAMKIEKPAAGRWKKLLSNYFGSEGMNDYVLEPKSEIKAYELVIYHKRRRS
ncbi:pullulanase [Natronobacillus azotifigens]|uniref:Type I pullulanase n=1 Tax=Natronobacillus azotifigens TaxID=472978 RepID=A0A9J6R7P9_9BACI|nr:type I pullulanase [Natronobacillus azotifigens]MCZ0701666.1 type I pullulanase [Natronobacillus azotifigens]